MKLHFFINEIEVRVATNSTIVETQDLTLDSGSITLAFNNIKKPIAPYSRFRIYDEDTNESLNFIISKDEVLRVSKKEEIYQHTLFIVQNTNELATRQVRNSSFTQPTTKKRTLYTNASGGCLVQNETYISNFIPYSLGKVTNYRGELVANPIQYCNKLKLDNREKYTGYLTGRCYLASASCRSVDNHSIVQDGEFIKPITNEFNIVLEANNSYGVTIDYLFGKVHSDSTITFDYERQRIKEFFENARAQNLELRSVVDYYTENRLRVAKHPSLDLSYNGYTTLVVVHIEIDIEIYYYSLLDILHTLLLQDKQSTSDISDKKEYAFHIPYSNRLVEDLGDYVAPNMYFTNSNLFDCVSEVLRVVDGLPTLDENKNLDIEYVNDISKEASEINFENYTITIDSDKYQNRLMSYYQNAREDRAISYPSANTFSRLTPKNYGVLEANSYQYETPYKIDYVDDIRIYTNQMVLATFDTYIEDFGKLKVNNVRAPFKKSLSYAHNIYESSLNSLFKASSSNDDFPTSFNTITYTRNSNIINLCQFVDINNDGVLDDTLKLASEYAVDIEFGNVNQLGNTLVKRDITLSNAFNDMIYNRYDIKLNIKYHAITDGVTSVETNDYKHDGDMLVTSNSASVDLYRMGVNMLSNLSMLGNEKYTCTLKLSSFDTRLRKGSIWLDDNNERYIANVVKTTFSTKENCVIVNVEFVKNFNQIYSNTQLFNEKRFYQIDNNLVTKGYQLYTDYLYLSLEDKSDLRSKVCYNDKIVRHAIFSSENDKYISSCFIATKQNYTYESNYNLREVNDLNYDCYYCQIPLHTYSTATTLNFEVSFDNSLNARNRIYQDLRKLGKTTLYCADDGFANYVSFFFNQLNNESMYAGDDFPLISDESIYNTNRAININNLGYYKRDNEILSLNYQVCILSTKNIIVSDMLTKRSALLESAKQVKYYKVHTSDLPFSIIDRKLNNYYCNANITLNSVSSANGIYGSYSLSFSKAIDDKYIAITDEEDNVLLSINEKISTNELTLYFFSSNKRLNLNE